MATIHKYTNALDIEITEQQKKQLKDFKVIFEIDEEVKRIEEFVNKELRQSIIILIQQKQKLKFWTYSEMSNQIAIVLRFSRRRVLENILLNMKEDILKPKNPQWNLGHFTMLMAILFALRTQRLVIYF